MQQGKAALPDLVTEASRQFSICNACRYCEGYCAVFPAVEHLATMSAGDLAYVANVCHDCRACYQACMYTAPHEFDLNLPELLSEARTASYSHYARPRAAARIMKHQVGLAVLLAAVMCAVVTAIMIVTGHADRFGAILDHPGSFYVLIPHVAMESAALAVTAIVGIVLAVSLTAFWRDQHVALGDVSVRVVGRAARDGLTLRWLKGGGADCYYPEADRPSKRRRRLHHAVAYGFLATFCATVAAFIYQSGFHELPPFGVWTVPVQLGLWGGVAVVYGTTALLLDKARGDRRLASSQAVAMDYVFLANLNLVALTGMLLLALRETGGMGPLLVLHLGLVFALIITTPYTKFVHGLYRLAALGRSAVDTREQLATPRAKPAELQPGTGPSGTAG